MIKKILISFCLTVIGFVIVPKTLAADVLFFDSTDNYLGACQLTNKSEWELKDDATVTLFQVWYNWSQGESNLPVKVFLNGEQFAEFDAKRGNCDPYQQTWCNADYQINKLFPKGKYSTEIPNARQCLKPKGTGAIRLYKDDSMITNVTPTSTVTEKKEVVVETLKEVAPSSCACSTKTIILYAGITSLISSAIFSLLFKRK